MFIFPIYSGEKEEDLHILLRWRKHVKFQLHHSGWGRSLHTTPCLGVALGVALGIAIARIAVAGVARRVSSSSWGCPVDPVKVLPQTSPTHPENSLLCYIFIWNRQTKKKNSLRPSLPISIVAPPHFRSALETSNLLKRSMRFMRLRRSSSSACRGSGRWCFKWILHPHGHHGHCHRHHHHRRHQSLINPAWIICTPSTTPKKGCLPNQRTPSSRAVWSISLQITCAHSRLNLFHFQMQSCPFVPPC